MRLSRRRGQRLEAQSIPGDFQLLLQRIDGLRPADRRFHEAAENLRQLRSFSFSRSNNLKGLQRHFQEEAFESLLDVAELLYQGRPLRPLHEAHQPILVIEDGPKALKLHWQTQVIEFFPVATGYVVTEKDEFRPLAQLSDRPEILLRALPEVPYGELDSFLERFLRRSRVSVELLSERLPPLMEADLIQAQVMLSEEEQVLRVDLSFLYHLGTERREIKPDEPHSHLILDEGLLRRDFLLEEQLWDQLNRHLSAPIPCYLRGNVALDFLIDAPRSLGEGWIILGAQSLLAHRVVGELSAKFSVPSGIDWLDLKLEFSVGSEQLPALAVLKSWRDGRRYQRLKDGSLARLPLAWLQQYGARALELEELRQTSGRLGGYIAPLLDGLPLDELSTPWMNLLEQLKPEQLKERPVPPGLKAQLRPYQLQGFNWLCTLRELKLGGCLADDMGLGKTVQAIAALLEAHPAEEPSLVVAPTSVIFNWLSELERFAPSLRCRLYHGSQRDHCFDGQDIIITSYTLLRLDEEHFRGRRWRTLLLDEAQQIKNPTSRIARMVRTLKAELRLALTGTPIENQVLELWSLFEFLMPGFFGPRGLFIKRYATPIQKDRDSQAARDLRARIQAFILRRRKQEVAQDLPPRQEQLLFCELGPEQRQLYEQIKSRYRESLLLRVKEKGMGGAHLSILQALTRLRQACADPALVPLPEAQGISKSAKLDLLMEILDETIPAGHRSLVFSQWPSLLRRVSQRLEERGFAWLFLDGSTPQRPELVRRWNDPKGPPVFLISLKAGGVGLNLTGADQVIHLDPWWNPAAENQATDRAHRIGQTRPVVVYKLLVKDSLEEKVLELQLRKKRLFETTVESDGLELDPQLDQQELEALLASGGQALLPPTQPPPETTPPSPLRITPAGHTPSTLIEQLKVGAQLNNAQVREYTGWSSEQARAWLQRQVQAQVLERYGQKRGTYYVVLAPH